MASLSRLGNVLVGVLTLIVCAFAPTMSATGGVYYSKDVEVCNNGKEKIWVATAYRSETSLFGPTTWRVKGWKKVSPNDCVEVHSSYTDPESRYSMSDEPFLAFRQIGKDGRDGIATYLPEESLFGGDRVRSASRQFCVHPTHNFDYEFSGEKMTAENCGPPFELVEFSIEVNPPYGRDSEITVNIDPSKATHVSPFGSPPSAAVAPKEKAEPEPNLFRDIFKAYEEAKREERLAAYEEKLRAARERKEQAASQQASAAPVAPPKIPDPSSKPGWLGITVQDLPPGFTPTFDIPLQSSFYNYIIKPQTKSGVLVTAVANNGPASKAFPKPGKPDILPGDVILMIRKNSSVDHLVGLNDVGQLATFMKTTTKGDEVQMIFWRKGKLLDSLYTVGEKLPEGH